MPSQIYKGLVMFFCPEGRLSPVEAGVLDHSSSIMLGVSIILKLSHVDP